MRSPRVSDLLVKWRDGYEDAWCDTKAVSLEKLDGHGDDDDDGQYGFAPVRDHEPSLQ